MNLVRIGIGCPTIVVVAALGGCAPALTEENAPEVAARTYCKKDRACDTDYWDDAGDDMDTCRVRRTDAFTNLRDLLAVAGLDVDLDELRSCLADVRSASCDDYRSGDYSNDCDDVFTF